MNHPNDEQWMAYLYHELDAAERESLKAHLRTCGECKIKVGGWQETQRNLAAGRWTPKRLRGAASLRPATAFKWAVAALFLCAGIAIGRLTMAPVSADTVRAEIEPQLRREFAQMLHDEVNKSVTGTLQVSGEQTKSLLANYAAAAETNRAADNAAILTALNRLSEQHIADYLLLKKDVDTVAVNTDLGFRSTQQELNQLADYPLPANAPNPSLK
jgi:anti-sigma factor RsiW